MIETYVQGGLAIGDFAPNFALPDAAGKVTMLLERTRGRPVALALLPAGPDLIQRLAVLAVWQTTFAEAGVDLMAISEGPAQAPGGSPPPFHLWSDPYGKVLGGYEAALAQVKGGPNDLKQVALAVLMLNPNQRLDAVFSAASTGSTTGSSIEAAIEKVCHEVMAFLGQAGARSTKPTGQVGATIAPVLVLRRLLAIDAGPEFGKSETTLGPGSAPAMAGDDPWPEPALDAAQRALGLSGDGRSLAASDPALARDLQLTVGRRLAVQLEKAYQFCGFRLLPPRIVGFPSGQGQTAAARLASLPDWPPRVRFIVLIGTGPACLVPPGLVFPEYGNRVHRLGLGDALVFSTSLSVLNCGCRDEGSRALLLAAARR